MSILVGSGTAAGIVVVGILQGIVSHRNYRPVSGMKLLVDRDTSGDCNPARWDQAGMSLGIVVDRYSEADSSFVPEDRASRVVVWTIAPVEEHLIAWKELWTCTVAVVVVAFAVELEQVTLGATVSSEGILAGCQDAGEYYRKVNEDSTEFSKPYRRHLDYNLQVHADLENNFLYIWDLDYTFLRILDLDRSFLLNVDLVLGLDCNVLESGNLQLLVLGLEDSLLLVWDLVDIPDLA